MAYDYYCDYGMKVKKEVIKSFQEYKDFVKLLSDMEVHQWTYAKAYEWGSSDEYDEYLENYANTLSEDDVTTYMRNNPSADDIIEALDAAIFKKFEEFKKAFKKKFRGYNVAVSFIDDDSEARHGCEAGTMLISIANPYKNGIDTISHKYEYAVVD